MRYVAFVCVLVVVFVSVLGGPSPESVEPELEETRVSLANPLGTSVFRSGKGLRTRAKAHEGMPPRFNPPPACEGLRITPAMATPHAASVVALASPECGRWLY